MEEKFKIIICSQCGLEIWYNTTNDLIGCTRCGFKVPVKTSIAEEEIELTQETLL